MRYITLKHPLVGVGYKPNRTQLKLLPYADVSFVFYERQSSDKNDQGLLIGRPVAPRPDKYVGLDLTWLDV